MYAICDIAMHLILTRAQYPEVREFSLEYTRIPDMYFQQQPESYQNNKIYVPLEMYNFNSSTVSSKTVPSIIVSTFPLSGALNHLTFPFKQTSSKTVNKSIAQKREAENSSKNTTDNNGTTTTETNGEEPPAKRTLRGSNQ